MATIGNHGLFCLEDENMAAIALYMQCVATQIDQTLADQDADLDTALTRPTVIVVNAANQTTTFPNASDQNVFDTIFFNNAGSMFSLQSTPPNIDLVIGSPLGTANPTEYPTGLWMIGATARMATAGAANAFGGRSLTLRVLDDLGSPSPTTVATWTDTTFFQGAMDSVCVKGPVILRGLNGRNAVRIRPLFAYADLLATGNVTVQAGAMLWATYIGPDELVEAVS